MWSYGCPDVIKWETMYFDLRMSIDLHFHLILGILNDKTIAYCWVVSCTSSNNKEVETSHPVLLNKYWNTLFLFFKTYIASVFQLKIIYISNGWSNFRFVGAKKLWEVVLIIKSLEFFRRMFQL